MPTAVRSFSPSFSIRKKWRAEIPVAYRSRLDPSVGCRAFSFGSEDRLDVEVKPLCNAASVSRIGFVEVLDLQFLDALRSLTEAAHDVADQSLLRIGGHQPEQVAGLRIVIAVAAMIVPRHRSAYHLRPLDVLWILHRAAKAVRFVVDFRAAVSIETHGAVFVIGL